ncbi:MAG: tRNA uridine-5-carboxymethylaminomethyl(34) synthesis GTPase MnmE [Mycoplasmataceae bacterium]|jgi:tRNA modification GTPase|nr:tRNA uridine-5-carboxymethylaminomethyl(34) synthesis GTPase MnmE [Mycoplasmataceae bacterium]
MSTIVALATYPADCAIHIIRISGPDAYTIINKILYKKITKLSYSIERNSIVCDNKIIDDVMLIKFVSPKSFTGEDLVEINCHGGIFLAKKIISLLIKFGCVYAEKGEFSKRSFLNNKISIFQAKNINELIHSKSDLQINIANNNLSKSALANIKKIHDELFTILGKIEVNIDYPEYEDNEISFPEVKAKLNDIYKELNKIYEDSMQILPIFSGIKIAIVGQPNAGKSSLLNLIAKEDKAIVSSIPGTTRDIIEVKTIMNGVDVTFYDTAGLRETKDEIEKIGVEKANKCIKNSDYVILLYDGSSKNELPKIKHNNIIYVANKNDINKNYILKDSLSISAKTGDWKELLTILKNEFKKIDFNDKKIIVGNNDLLHLKKSLVSLKHIISSMKKNQIDMILYDLHLVYDNFVNIFDKPNDEDFINKMFANFCLGK